MRNIAFSNLASSGLTERLLTKEDRREAAAASPPRHMSPPSKSPVMAPRLSLLGTSPSSSGGSLNMMSLSPVSTTVFTSPGLGQGKGPGVGLGLGAGAAPLPGQATGQPRAQDAGAGPAAPSFPLAYPFDDEDGDVLTLLVGADHHGVFCLPPLPPPGSPPSPEPPSRPT